MNTAPTRLLFIFLLNLIFFSGFAQKEIYELRIYKMKTAGQIKAIDNYLENAYLPALHRIGIKQIGVFKPISNDTSALKEIIVIVPYISLDVWHRTSSVLASDQVYTDNAKAFMDADTDSYPYLRMESTLMEAFPDQMKLIPTTLKMTPGAVYEMRSYESPSEELHRVKVDMFNDGGEITLFKRLDFQSVFYADVISGCHMPNLVYMVVFENAAAHDAHWKAFGDSKEWKTISTDPKYRNKISVSHIDSILMHRTSYSDL